MANYYKINGDGLRVPEVVADPSPLLDGTIWYNITEGVVKIRQNGVTITTGQVTKQFSDAEFRIFDDGDSTKLVAFEASNVGPGQTRTITMPDADVDLAQIAQNQADIAAKQDPMTAGDGIDITGNAIAVDLAADPYLEFDAGDLKASVSASFAAAASGELMDAADIKGAVDLKADATDLNLYIPLTEKGAALGVAELDAGGKVPASQLTISAMEYKGNWAASTNTPTLANGTGNTGDVYIASDAGSVDFGAGAISFVAGDWVVYNGSIWEKSINSNQVQSVNGQTGVVVLDTSDIAENGNLYFTNARVLASTLTGFVAGGDVDIIATDSVLEAFQKAQGQINARIGSVFEDGAPALGGDLIVGPNAIVHTPLGLEKGLIPGATYYDDYDHALTLSASTTAVIGALTVAHGDYDAQEISYKISAGGGVRVGRIFIATNGSDVAITDSYSDTADLDIEFSAAINGANIEVSYNNSSVSAGTMRAQTRRFKA